MEHGFYHLMFSPVYEFEWSEKTWEVWKEQCVRVVDLIMYLRRRGIQLNIEHFNSFQNGAQRYPCLTGDTKISLLNGTEIPIKDLVDKKDFWVYSCMEDGKIVPGKATKVWKTGVKPVVKITLDNGESFKCTEDHLLMLKSGVYKKAKDCLNESLMPLYRGSDKRGYETFKSNHNEKWYPTHLIVNAFFKGPKYKGEVDHHKKIGNIRNNEPDNLDRMTDAEHKKIHNEFLTENREINSNRATAMNKKMWSDPIHRERLIKQCKRAGQNNIKHLIKYAKSDEGRKQSFISAKKMNGIIWSDPEFIRNHRERTTRLNKEGLKGFGLLWKDPEFRIKMKSVCSENGKKNTANQSGKNNPNYKDGKHCRFVNHEVISIEPIGYQTVYDIEVDKFNNFALSSGIFVHNCGAGRWYVGFGTDGSNFALPQIR